MKVYSILLVLAWLTISCACSVWKPHEQNKEVKFLQGNWRSKEDKNWSLSFKNQYLVERYEEEILGHFKFSLTKNSCDERYANDLENAFFLSIMDLEDDANTCWEITTLVESTFSYRETISGRLHTFVKILD